MMQSSGLSRRVWWRKRRRKLFSYDQSWLYRETSSSIIAEQQAREPSSI
jgi:serine/threonine protein phosphatase PrpC